LDDVGGSVVDAVVYTDGSWPDQRKAETEEPRVGAVAFCRHLALPLACSAEVPIDVVERWLPRSNQIAMVELVAAVVALETFGVALSGKRVIWLIDSESVLGGLVKGNSSKEDLGPLVAEFWRLVRKFEIEVFLDRIPTDGNLSDKPSRASWAVAARAGWAVVPAAVPAAVSCLRPAADGPGDRS
jgi:hypothetical protein